MVSFSSVSFTTTVTVIGAVVESSTSVAPVEVIAVALDVSMPVTAFSAKEVTLAEERSPPVNSTTEAYSFVRPVPVSSS